MGTNTITPFFKETIVVKEIVEANVNIDSTFPMLEVWRIAFNLKLHHHIQV
jgi:hypothetical protein